MPTHTHYTNTCISLGGPGGGGGPPFTLVCGGGWDDSEGWGALDQDGLAEESTPPPRRSIHKVRRNELKA